jgi:rhodanese-related sulfurtransferase
MNNNKTMTAILFLAFGMAGLSAESPDKTVVSQTITNKDAYKMIQDNGKNKNFLLVDVRTPEEFKADHLKGAVNIDYYAPDFKDFLKKLDKSKKTLIYCRSGNRSAKSLPIFRELGFKEVYNMAGGVIEWTANGYPLTRN